MTWFQGPNNPIWHRRLAPGTRHEPFTPRVPAWFYNHPAFGAGLLAAAGIGSSGAIVRGMAGWPTWMIFPTLIGAVLALTATVVGLGLLVALILQPILGSRSLDWGADPVSVLGLPMTLQKKCEDLGFWTCESMLAAIEKHSFPWIALEYDERMQVQRAVAYWHAKNTTRPDGE